MSLKAELLCQWERLLLKVLMLIANCFTEMVHQFTFLPHCKRVHSKTLYGFCFKKGTACLSNVVLLRNYMKKPEALVLVLLGVFGKVHSPLHALVQLSLGTLQALTFFEIVRVF